MRIFSFETRQVFEKVYQKPGEFLIKVRYILPQNGNGFEQKSAEKIEYFPYYSYFLLKTLIFVRLFIHVIDTERDRTSI